MRRSLVILLLLVLASPAGPAAADGSPRPVSGMVTALNHELRTVQLGTRTFHVPGGVEEFDELAPGVGVLIHYENIDGRSVVSEIEIPEAG